MINYMLKSGVHRFVRLQVRTDFLGIIDNIQKADPEVVFTSQKVTRSSKRYDVSSIFILEK